MARDTVYLVRRNARRMPLNCLEDSKEKYETVSNTKESYKEFNDGYT